MGADRRGPLAAFVVVAVIAAILLVTSVRSHAAPGWLRTPVASADGVPSAADHVWSHATPRVHQVVLGGVSLGRRPGQGSAAGRTRPGVGVGPSSSAAGDPSSTVLVPTSSAVTSAQGGAAPSSGWSGSSGSRRPTAQASDAAVQTAPTAGTLVVPAGHGRGPGYGHGHRHGQGNGHRHGQGNAHRGHGGQRGLAHAGS